MAVKWNYDITMHATIADQHHLMDSNHTHLLFWVNGLEANGRFRTPEPSQAPLGGSAFALISIKCFLTHCQSLSPMTQSKSSFMTSG